MLRWLESVEEDLKNVGVRNWRREEQEREQWRASLEGAKVYQGLQWRRRRRRRRGGERRKGRKRKRNVLRAKSI
jgi:hypothetical protein